MASLTSFLPSIAPTLRLNAPSLYERQRALVRLGLLPKPQGRGRGSGAEANAQTVALLLVSIMATDSLSETSVVKALAQSAFLDRERKKVSKCPHTQQEHFVDALACVLADDKLARFQPSVTVSRDTLGARISWRHGQRMEASYFGVPPEVMSSFIEREARLHYRALTTIKNELAGVQSEGRG